MIVLTVGVRVYHSSNLFLKKVSNYLRILLSLHVYFDISHLIHVYPVLFWSIYLRVCTYVICISMFVCPFSCFRGNSQEKTMKRIIKNKCLLRDIEMLSPEAQTTTLESHHAVVWHFAQKIAIAKPIKED